MKRKYVVSKFNGSRCYGQQFYCACCKTRLIYGYRLNTGEIIDGHCRAALQRVADHISIDERTAHQLNVSRRQLDFFGVPWQDSPRQHPELLSKEERAILDAQAIQDEKDIFG